MTRVALKSIILGILAGASLAAAAQDFPSKPVRMIVSFPPGSTTDIVGRVLGAKLAEIWSQPVVIENRAGAAGNIGTQLVAKASPDGYTILCSSGSFAINQSLYKAPGYSTKEFTPIVRLGDTPNAIVVHPSVAANSIRELVELARRQPLSYASAGSGTGGHILMEWVKREAKVDITHVPFAPATAGNAVVGNQAPIGLISIPAITPHLKSGRVKALAVTGDRRIGALPDIPHIGEAGFPGFTDTLWWGFFAPAGTPAAIVAKINADTQRALEMPDVRERLSALGFESTRNTPQEFADEVQREMVKYARVIREIGVTAD